MKNFIVFLTAISIGISSFASESVREELFQKSGALLQRHLSEEDFLSWAENERNRNPFNSEERRYLEDLSQKMPENVRTRFCPDRTSGLCSESLLEKTMQTNEVQMQEDLPLEIPPEKTPAWKNPWVWTVVGALLGGSILLQGKEIQFSSRR